MNVLDTSLPGVKVIRAKRFPDERGWFAELWNVERYREVGIASEFAQDNVSFSTRGVLRGLHFQEPNGQGKLISALHGTIFDVAVDVRPDSPTFGRWEGRVLSQENGEQLWIPEGFAHGFLVLSDSALVHYNCTTVYDPAGDRSLAWDDPDVGIDWPETPALISPKDRAAPRLRDLANRNS